MTLESKLQALVARLEGCSEWSSTPDEIADELKALLAERQPALSAEQAGKIMHQSWCETKRKQGFHHPNECPLRTNVEVVKDLKPLHELCKFCHFDLRAWGELPEAQKEINRHAFDCLNDALAERQEPPVSVETVLQWLRKQGAIYGALPSVTGDGIAEAIEQHFALTMVKEKR